MTCDFLYDCFLESLNKHILMRAPAKYVYDQLVGRRVRIINFTPVVMQLIIRTHQEMTVRIISARVEFLWQLD